MPQLDPETVRRDGARAARGILLAGRRLGGILWRRKLLVAAGPAVALGLAAAHVATLPPLFEAETRVALVGDAGSDPRSAGPLPGPAGEAVDLADQLPLIMSRAAAERLIDRLDLQLSAEFNPKLSSDGVWGARGSGALDVIAGWLDARSDSDLSDAERAARLRDRIVDRVLPRIQARPADASTLSLRFVAADPRLAAAGANALAQLYLELRAEARQQERQRERTRLAAEVEDLAAALADTESAIAELRATSRAGLAPASEQDLLGLTGELAYWRGERAALEAQLALLGAPVGSDAAVDHAAESVDLALLGEPGAPEIEAERAATERLPPNGGRDPQLSRLPAEPAALGAGDRFEVQQRRGQLSREIAIIRSRETALEERIGTLREQLAQSRAAGNLQALERQAEANRERLLTHLARLEQLDAAPRVRAPAGRIVAPAIVPDEPRHPRASLIYAAAVCLGLLAGCLLALGAEAWQRARA